MMENSPILGSVIVLVAWSLVMWIWMYATRIPAIAAAKMELDPNAPNGQQMAQLPPKVRWKADNYNHLMEQPTIFYALAITLAVLGEGEGANAMLAWTYVGLRIVHSLVQVLVNKIEVRFTLFSLSTLPLFALTYNAATAFFGAG
ncbi:MAPEG family protein [Litorivivens sp.]|uniref:MAPEG family protein n=1 Tax=Litorivivens sp. TaxID=2020868 RepID=UPI003564D862